MRTRGQGQKRPTKRPRRDTERPRSCPPIEDVLRKIASEVPQEEWDALPSDLIENLDHYVYGVPKR
jgi:hypothetical protein